MSKAHNSQILGEKREIRYLCVPIQKHFPSKIGHCVQPKREKGKRNHLGMAVRLSGEHGKLGCELVQGGTACAPLYNIDSYFSGLYGWHEISSAHMTHTRTLKLVHCTIPYVQAKAVFAEHLRDKASELMQTYCHNPVFPPF